MIDFLTSLSGMLSPLWGMSLTAAYAAAIVALLRLALKKRAPRQVLCLLWLVVFARLLVPVNLESPLSILPDGEQVQAVQGLPSKLAGAEPPAAPDQAPAPAQTPSWAGAAAQPAHQGAGEPVLALPGGAAPAPAQPQAVFPWQVLLAGVWLAGAAAMGLYGLISSLRLRRRLYDAIRAGDGAWEHPAVRSPFILGMLRPRIYLPAGLSGQPRQFILCHERAHLRRRDHIVKPVCWLALALHWFNPLVWLAFVLMSRDIEAACDEAVILRLGPQVKADYSATLLALATNGRMPAPCPLAFDEGDAKGRIKNVLSYRRPALWVIVVSVAAAVLAAVCLLTDPVSAETPEPDASASQGVEDGPLDPWMEEILAGRQHFTSMERGDAVNIDLLNGAYPPDIPFNSITLSKFAIVDLNRDGVNELVLWPSIDGDDSLERISTLGYLVLHRTGDDVFACNPSYRSFTDIKTDGIFRFSGSAMGMGFASLRFTDNDFSLNEITYCEGVYDDNNELKEVYFVDNRSATREEFDAAMSDLSAKPGVTWYTCADGQVKAPAIRVPIPLDDSAVTAPVPDFLDADQQELYRQARTMYVHIFGANTEEVDNWPQAGMYGPSQMAYDGYNAATGLYSNWSDFEEAVLSVFTQEYWDARNSLGDGQPIYKNIDGQLCYAALARGSGGCNGYFPETFRLVSQTENAIEFVMTGYYSDPRPYYGIVSDEKVEAWLAAGWEESIEFPMRMVKTEKGWRFDEFYCAGTDNGSGLFQAVPNPDAPVLDLPPEPTATPEPSPEPTPTASPAPAACQHGLDNAVYDFSGGSLVIRCELDGTGYPVPIITEDNWVLQYHKDLDGDGHIEHLFSRTDASRSRNEGILYVVDVQDGALNTYTFDPSYLADDFNDTVTYEIVGEYQELRFTYQGIGMGVDLSEQWSAMMNHGRSYYPRAYAPETFYSFDGEDIDMMIPIYLENGFGGHICYLSWSHLRYTGSGFRLASSSFGYRMP